MAELKLKKEEIELIVLIGLALFVFGAFKIAL